MKELTAPIVEIFESIQGEGPLIGTPALFIRFAGCNLHCKDCDSKFSWDENTTTYTVKDITDRIRESNMKYIIFTGGEPMLQKYFMYEVMHYFERYYKRTDYIFVIETNGTIFDELIFENVDCIIVSPKFELFHGKIVGNDDVLSRIVSLSSNIDICIKFVISDLGELDIIEDLISSNFHIEKGLCYIAIQPNFIINSDEDIMLYLQKTRKLIEVILRRTAFKKVGVRVIPQVHKLFWKNKRGV